ncbi:MAG: Na+/H+ antiporter NhaC [Flavobacteriaceae bacterium CG_4_10_14_3_um_filter_31_253]|nr:Na+/H+ antiporter NhaC [Flavobacteriia bacterium]OIP47168.1 MAG: Na+/H+ antiporter NhaC [Flavobacteriaceae bacterium CG2_30_31_66]PIV97679.1 MAG: Na+/H+ antiporter NhaC [Flavobacteriaceae bacterium CG17_big_fil_post_rev_8_21_14_2_50_31_13]PIX15081.1 MAG: Na+/H+ antiporter NhaC [Flavobacteriaceae bacterium CG_4_8_14_3_um_filter_31_8]PIY13814.1 MAG: Na+/H+ antiporter NhaC [Flavobacteriaceae bacterium CG_4_10_14_3_um_filter_31_253]PIZ10710.1 MAG: Na+/H+ antiporter NhaC [Flavobacteriaceae bacte
MHKEKNISEIHFQEQKIIDNKELSIWEALFPVLALVVMLAFNVFVFGDDALSGSNQFILLLGGAVAAIVGFKNNVTFDMMMEEVAENIKSTSGAILILLMVGALAGTWLISGVIPAMIYYGLQVLNPTIFLAACLIICSVISIATGSSWTTSATVGIALIGIGDALGISMGMTAGAVLSGAYFGDKMSPMSDTTNLAPAMAGTDLFTHIKYMTITTVPTFIISLLFFVILGFTQDISGKADTNSLLLDIDKAFHISPWLFVVPVIVIGLIVKKTPPLVALLAGTILAAIFALIFQPEVVAQITGVQKLNFTTAYKGILKAITVETSVATENKALADLFTAGGMSKMMGTIWLILCAMVFGGIMDAIGALARISSFMLGLFDSVFGLFASTVFTCIGLNFTASDQYLAIVVPGKMYAKAFKDKGLAPENLSRTLEDSGTVTSVLIPWNTCGAYHSGVLGVSVFEFGIYAIFNWLSPFVTLFFAAFNIKIRQLVVK